MDKYKQYVDVQWWNGIDKRDIENWIKNFGASQELAELILDNVIFYNSLQLKAYTRTLVNDMKEQVYMCAMEKNQFLFIEDKFLISKWSEYLEKTKFMPAALPTDPGSSAYKVIGYWRSALKQKDSPLSTLDNIEDNYDRGIRRFVLVDDFSGSGRQMMEILNYRIEFKGKKIEVGRLPDIVEGLEIIVAVYVIHKTALETIGNKFGKIKLMYVDYIGDDLNYLNKDALIYEKTEMDKRQKMISEIKKLSNNIMASDEEWRKLSSYVLNIPIVFEHGCPNNALLLLFAHSDNWQQLFKRGEEI